MACYQLLEVTYMLQFSVLYSRKNNYVSPNPSISVSKEKQEEIPESASSSIERPGITDMLRVL